MRGFAHGVSSCNICLFVNSMEHYVPLTSQTIHMMPFQVSCANIALTLTGAYFGAILPDIDHQYSNVHFLMAPFSKMFKIHRGITHSIFAEIFIILLSMLIYHLNPRLAPFTLSLSLGYLIHLIEDSRSTAGVMWLYPFTHYTHSKKNKNSFYKKRKHWIFIYRSSGIFEYFFTWLNIAIFICYVLNFLSIISFK